MPSTSSTTDRPPASRTLVLLIVCLAQFMVVLDATIVNVALPSIQRDLGFTAGDLQWVVNGYTLVFGGFLLLGGRAADLLGRRTLFLIGIALFSLASLANGWAESSTMLIVARAVQGLGAALVSPAALSIVTTTYADGAERTKALGVWSAVAAGGGACGLLVGGVLTESLSWPWIFFINAPVGLLTIALALRFVPQSRAGGATAGFDLGGAVSVTAGLVVLTYAIVKADEFGWTDARIGGLAAVAAALFAVFVAIERRSAAPLVRLGIFRVRSLAIANGVMLLVTGALFSFFFFSSIYVQEVLGYGPMKAGLAFLPVTIGIGIGAGLAQRMIGRLGVKTVLLAALATAAAGLGMLTAISPSGTYLADILPGLLLIALGMGGAFVPLTLTATTNVSSDDQGLASGIFTTAQQVGGALGLAALSTVATDRSTAWLAGLGRPPVPADSAVALVHGFQTAFAAGAVMLALGLLALAFLLRRRDVAHVVPDGSALASSVAA